MADTDPDAVREKLGVSESEYPDMDIMPDIQAAEALVEARVGGLVPQTLEDRLATLVAADLVFPRVSGEASAEQVSVAEQGERRVEYAISRADRSVGNSAHWQQALKLDYTGRLDTNHFSSYTVGGN